MSTHQHRDLIQRLADSLDQHTWLYEGYEDPLVTEASAYLATPEPAVGPTDEELEALANKAWASKGVLEEYGSIENAFDCCAFARAVLARWGHQPPQPIPLTERQPGPEDCDAEGRCWVFDQGDAVTEPAWNLTSAADLQDLRQMMADGTLIGLCERWRLAWLPAHALPLPPANSPHD